jgi:hypothetical protein
MRYNYKVTSSVSSGKINLSRNDASAFATALAQAKTSNSYKPKIRKLVRSLDVKVARAVISAFGGGRFSTGAPVIKPTFTTTLDITRQQGTNDITSINRGIVTRVSLRNPMQIENIEISRGDAYSYNEELANFITKNKTNSVALFKYLTTNALTTRLVSNFNDIGLDYIQSGKILRGKISFSLSDINRAIASGKARVRVVQTDNTIDIDIYFTDAVMSAAASAANAVVQHELGGELGKQIASIIAEETVIASRAVIKDVRDFLTSLNVEYVLRYLPGNVLNRTNIILNTIADKQIQYQSFLSSIQWTALVQARLGDTMERVGNPEPPDLKERTGRFRSSVNIIPNYRANLLYYTYLPLYSSLERYGYRPDVQVETAIREVAQRQFARKFDIIKGMA